MAKAVHSVYILSVCLVLLSCRDSGPKELASAIAAGNSQEVERMLDARPELLEEPVVIVSSQGSSGGVSSGGVMSVVQSLPLYTAASETQLEIAQILIERGADIAGRAYDGETALHAGLRRAGDDLSVVELLLAHGADPLSESDSGTRPVHAAASYGCCYAQGLDRLLSIPIDTDIADDAGWTALHITAIKGFVRGAATLCGSGANQNALTHKGKSPLDIALENERKAMAQWFSQSDGCTLAAEIAPKITSKELRSKVLAAWADCYGGEANRCNSAGVLLGHKTHGPIDRTLAQKFFRRG